MRTIAGALALLGGLYLLLMLTSGVMALLEI